MPDDDRARQEMMLYHLEAASAYAEEIGDARSREIIDRAKREVGNNQCNSQRK